jgi:hypothetical protein
MAAVDLHEEVHKRDPIPLMEAGDHLTRGEFEALYALMPAGKKAELLEGVVYMPSPVTDQFHGNPHFRIIQWLGWYQFATAGTAGGDNSTLRLDMINEPQPDLLLRILPTHGGGCGWDAEGYLRGSPEFIAEVSGRKVNYDSGVKREVYLRHGVKEYAVWRVLEKAVDWYVLRDGRYEPLVADEHGVYRSGVFPGLWLDVPALIQDDLTRLARVAQEGIASPEHVAFVQRLGQLASGQHP